MTASMAPAWAAGGPEIPTAASRTLPRCCLPAVGAWRRVVEAAWKRSSWSRRRIVLKTIKKWLVDDVETICRVACRDTGKTAVDAVLGELLTTFSKLDWLIGNLEAVLRPQTRPNNLMMVHKRCTVHHEPVGVVSALVSWNYPCHNALSPALAALASGNAIVVKGSEMVVWSTTPTLSRASGLAWRRAANQRTLSSSSAPFPTSLPRSRPTRASSTSPSSAVSRWPDMSQRTQPRHDALLPRIGR
ncbi:hypothetical protein L7F22_064207 [Adiantum nelumboides]|nr:hypothetical protein [Adiantum nelumboides]